MSRSDPEPYFNPDDPEDPGPPEVAIPALQGMLEAKLAARKVLPSLNDRLLSQVEKSGALASVILPPKTIAKLNEMVESQMVKFPPETMRKLEAIGPKLDPALTRKLADAARDIEKVHPIATPFRSRRIGKPLLELSAVPEPTPLKWWQTSTWKVTVETATVVGGVAAVIGLAILII